MNIDYVVYYASTDFHLKYDNVWLELNTELAHLYFSDTVTYLYIHEIVESNDQIHLAMD
jgi:hypothetical protein